MSMKTVRAFSVLAITLFLTTTTGSPTANAATVPPDAKDILTEEGNWRWHQYLQKPTITVETLKAAGQEANAPYPIKGRQLIAPYTAIDQKNTAPPSADWAAYDCNDYDWPRSQLKGIAKSAFGRYSIMSVRFRGKFRVDNPKTAKGIFLTLKYYGGVIVYLNGTEIARQHLPQGTLGDNVLAEAYPDALQVDESGTPIPSARFRRRLPPDVKAKLDAVVEQRTRTLGPIELPTSALKKGMNVLAVEIRRSPYPVAAKRWLHGKIGRTMPSWVPAALSEIRLQATSPGVQGGHTRPSGIQVWNEDRNVRLWHDDFGDPVESLRPVMLSGAKNGTYSGQVGVGSSQPIRGLKVTCEPLTMTQGGATIVSDQIDILYGVPMPSPYELPGWLEGLESQPLAVTEVDAKAGAAVVPVVIRVQVPKDATAGEYRGHVVIEAQGTKPVRVPIELHVADWTVPDPKDYTTYVGIYQSPTSVALQYTVPMWSDAHWKLLDKSAALLGRAGNKVVQIPVVDKTQLGNEEGFIHWVKKSDGSYEYDFTIFDRYMDLMTKYCGPQDHVVLQVWHAGGWKARPVDQPNTVTVVDPKTGKHSHQQVPNFDTDEALAFWKPLFDAIRSRLEERGMKDVIRVGILSDSTAPSSVFAMFDKALPPVAKWHRGNHTANRSPKPYKADKGGGLVVLHEYCYGLSIADPDKPLPPFWNLRGKPATAYDRISGHESQMPLVWYRTTGALSLFRQTQGIGRVCLDFWPVIESQKGRKSLTWIYNRYPQSSCTQRRPSMQKLAFPGKDGAITSFRYEALLEGLQDAEAVVAISRAVDQHADKLGEPLATECRETLADNIRYMIFHRDRTPMRPYHYGWQELSGRLYACAAKVQKKLGE